MNNAQFLCFFYFLWVPFSTLESTVLVIFWPKSTRKHNVAELTLLSLSTIVLFPKKRVLFPGLFTRTRALIMFAFNQNKNSMGLELAGCTILQFCILYITGFLSEENKVKNMFTCTTEISDQVKISK